MSCAGYRCLRHSSNISSILRGCIFHSTYPPYLLEVSKSYLTPLHNSTCITGYRSPATSPSDHRNWNPGRIQQLPLPSRGSRWAALTAFHGYAGNKPWQLRSNLAACFAASIIRKATPRLKNGMERWNPFEVPWSSWVRPLADRASCTARSSPVTDKMH